jgi:hypothetical protein
LCLDLDLPNGMSPFVSRAMSSGSLAAEGRFSGGDATGRERDPSSVAGWAGDGVPLRQYQAMECEIAVLPSAAAITVVISKIEVVRGQRIRALAVVLPVFLRLLPGFIVSQTH